MDRKTDLVVDLGLKLDLGLDDIHGGSGTCRMDRVST